MKFETQIICLIWVFPFCFQNVLFLKALHSSCCNKLTRPEALLHNDIARTLCRTVDNQSRLFSLNLNSQVLILSFPFELLVCQKNLLLIHHCLELS